MTCLKRAEYLELDTGAWSRFRALLLKEVRQVLRDKRLIYLLLVPPTFQLGIYGAVLNPIVTEIPMVVVDESKTTASRELVDVMTKSRAFKLVHSATKYGEADKLLSRGDAIIELNIPPGFQRELNGEDQPAVQLLVNAVDAFSSGLAVSYAKQAIALFPDLDAGKKGLAQPQVIFAYNPGLISSWFFVSGLLGMVIIMTCSLVAVGVVGREKDSGTLEQLLVTPAANLEILAAKVVPLLCLLFADVLLGTIFGHLVFGLPLNGSLPLFMICSLLFVVVGISIGILLATISRNQQQAQLLSFFINLPMIQLSGSIAPFESMPQWCQTISWFNPLRHFTEIVRAILLRGAGMEAIWPNVAMLATIAILMFTASISMFRKRIV